MQQDHKYVTLKGKTFKVYLSPVQVEGATRTRESFVLRSQTEDAGRFSAECIRCRKHWMTNAQQTRLFWKARFVNADGTPFKEPWEYQTVKTVLLTPECPHCATQSRKSIPRSYARVKGVHNPDVKCDSRCTNAVGPDCSCACGGANHGSAAVC